MSPELDREFARFHERLSANALFDAGALAPLFIATAALSIKALFDESLIGALFLFLLAAWTGWMIMEHLHLFRALAAPHDPGIPEFRSAQDRAAFHAGVMKARFEFMTSFFEVWLGGPPAGRHDDDLAHLIDAVATGMKAMSALLPPSLQDVNDGGTA